MKFQFDSLNAFLTMKGHGPYVWASYLLVYSILIFLTLSPLLAKRKFLKQQKKLIQIQQSNQPKT